MIGKKLLTRVTDHTAMQVLGGGQSQRASEKFDS